MEDGSPESKKSGKNSTKSLVRILVIVGIGIPVIVELLTLFNLVNVQLFSDENKQEHQVRSVQEDQSYVVGDTLFTEFAQPIIIHSMRIMVSTRQWRYEINLMPADTAFAHEDLIGLDSLRLESGKVLTPEEALRVQDSGHGGEQAFRAEWKLPSGDIPKMLFLRSVQPSGADSTELVRKKVRLGKIPIRYEQE